MPEALLVPQPLAGQVVSMTGRFAAMSQGDLAVAIREYGGQHLQNVTRSTTMLVIGQDGWPMRADGRLTLNLQSARELEAAGHPIEIVTEEEFFLRIGLGPQPAIHSRYTTMQLSRLLGLPGSRIRAWARAGLIRPVETIQRLAFFDFQQVARAKSLYELTAAGVGIHRIRESLAHLHRWLPETGDAIWQLAVLELDGDLLVHLQDGRIAEPCGQLRFEFMLPEADEPSLSIHQDWTAQDWFLRAVEYENLGQPAEAAAAYAAAIQHEPDDPVLHFNLGNQLYASGNLAGAAEAFEAATQFDPDYVEAWNNLANVLAELDRDDLAIPAFRRALEIVPTYADAHYNLAATLSALGRVNEARPHWRAYLQYGPPDDWADEARARLE